MRTGSNLPAVGEYNQTLVLDLIRRSPEGLSRVELSARTGLSAQTLSNVTRRLADDGLIIEAGKVISGPGKPRTLLKLEPRSRFAVGVHLDPVVDTIVLVDMAGEVIAHDEIPALRDAAPGDLVAAVATAVDAIVVRAEVSRDLVLGVGVAAPGPFDARGGRLLDPPLLPQWHNVNVREDLGAATGLPVIVEKDVTAAMVGEMWFDRSDALSDAMFLYYGAGVGMGLAVAGAPVRGRTGNAGGIAHVVVDAEGPLCACGSRGCLGVSIEPRVLIAEAGYDDVDPRAGLDRLVRDAADPRTRGRGGAAPGGGADRPGPGGDQQPARRRRGRARRPRLGASGRGARRCRGGARGGGCRVDGDAADHRAPLRGRSRCGGRGGRVPHAGRRFRGSTGAHDDRPLRRSGSSIAGRIAIVTVRRASGLAELVHLIYKRFWRRGVSTRARELP